MPKGDDCKLFVFMMVCVLLVESILSWNNDHESQPTSESFLQQIDESQAKCSIENSFKNLTILSDKSMITSEEREFNSIFKSNKKHIYWKLTEDGLVYCSKNCLLTSKKIQQNFDYIPQIDSHSTLNIINNEKIQFYNKSNLRKYLIPNLEQPVVTQTIKYASEFNVNIDEVNFLNCLPYSDHTNYDFLKSFTIREKLNGVPEPDLITMFDRNSKIDLETLRQRLIEMKKELKGGIRLFNRLGNFHRLVGSSNAAIECFRRALFLEPYNSDVLLNTARLLYKLKFYEDSIYLIRKSLDYIRSDRSPWLQHLTLVEIFKINGFYEEALIHAQYLIKIKPDYKNGTNILKELLYLIKNRPENCERCNENNEIFNLNYGVSNFFNRLNSMIVYFLNVLNVSSSMYLQFSFHIFLLMIIFLVGIFLSLFNVIFDDETSLETTNKSNKTKNFNENCKSNSNSENQLNRFNVNSSFTGPERKRSNFNPVRCFSKKC